MRDPDLPRVFRGTNDEGDALVLQLMVDGLALYYSNEEEHYAGATFLPNEVLDEILAEYSHD